MKQLSNEAIFEMDIEEKFAGKLWAYVPVIGDKFEARLGIAVANEAGYCPVPEFWANGSYSEMSAEADRLNEARGMAKDEAFNIIISSMASGKVA